MNLKHLFANEDAVSPVIGVILMVAITVILAAVIGTFVLGLGENVQDSAPQANFQFEYGTGTFGSATSEFTTKTATITHTGGEDVEANNVVVEVNGNEAFGLNTDDPAKAQELFTGTIQTGSSATVAFVGDSDVLTESDTGGTTTVEEVSGSLSATGGGTATALSSDDEIRVIWTSPSGGSSQTIGQSTVPN